MEEWSRIGYFGQCASRIWEFRDEVVKRGGGEEFICKKTHYLANHNFMFLKFTQLYESLYLHIAYFNHLMFNAPSHFTCSGSKETHYAVRGKKGAAKRLTKHCNKSQLFFDLIILTLYIMHYVNIIHIDIINLCMQFPHNLTI